MAAIITSGIIILSIFFLLPWLFFLPKVRYHCDSVSRSILMPQAVLAAIVVLVVYASKCRNEFTRYATAHDSSRRSPPRDHVFLAHASVDRLPSDGRNFLSHLIPVYRGAPAWSSQHHVALISDRTCCERCVLPHSGRAEIDANSHQDHWPSAQLGRMGADRRGRIGAGGDTRCPGRAHTRVFVVCKYRAAQGEASSGEPFTTKIRDTLTYANNSSSSMARRSHTLPMRLGESLRKL